MNRGLKLPIFYKPEGYDQLEKLGLAQDLKMEEAEIRMLTFYHINAVGPYREDGKTYAKLFVDGDEFIVAMPIDELELLIDNTWFKGSEIQVNIDAMYPSWKADQTLPPTHTI